MMIFDENRSYVIGKLKTNRSNAYDDNGIQFVNYSGISPIYLTGKQLKEKGIHNSEELYESLGNKLFGFPTGTYISICEIKNGKPGKVIDSGTILKNNGLGDSMLDTNFVERYDRTNKEQNNFFKEQLARKEDELIKKDKEINRLQNLIIEKDANATELRTTNARLEIDTEWYKKKIDELNAKIDELKTENKETTKALNDSGAGVVEALASFVGPLADLGRQWIQSRQQNTFMQQQLPMNPIQNNVPVNNSTQQNVFNSQGVN